MRSIGIFTNRRLTFCLIAACMVCAVCLIFGGAERVSAGNWHNSPLVCSDCHAMHASTGGGATLYNAGAGFTNLLKGSSTNKICLDCHASNGANAISTFRVAGSTITDSWSGGRFGPDAVYTTISTPGDYANTVGHDLEVATNTTSPPGADATDAYRKAGNAKMLNCASCHDQHGNSNYRNLSYDPNTSNAEVYSCTVTVTVADTGAKTTQVWKGGAVAYNEGMSSFCQDCHEKFGPINTFGGPTGGTAGFYAAKYDNEGLVDNAAAGGNLNTHHPIDLDLTAGMGANYNLATVRGGDTYPLGKSSAAIPFTDGAANHVQCVTCHWAHGSPTNNNDSLRWNMTNDLLAGSSSGCQTCHNK